MKNRPLCMCCSAFVFVFCLGVYFFGNYFLTDLAPSQAEQTFIASETVSLSGVICQKTEKPDVSIYILSDVLIQSAATIRDNQSYVEERKILIYDETKHNIKLGERIKVWGEIKFFEPARNPGNFDRKQFYQKQGIHAYLWVNEIKRVSKSVKNPVWSVPVWWGRNKLYEVRALLERGTYQVMETSYASALNAIILGDKSNMDEDLKEHFQNGGIVHILSISGLHLSFLGVGVYEFFRKRTGSFRMGAILGGIFLALYMAMVGLGVSIIRAVVMFVFRIGANIYGRSYDALTALSASAVVVLLWRPLSVIDSGFYLSFGAVLAIILVVPVFQNRGIVLELFGSSLGIYLFTIPILLRSYYVLSPYSILINIIIIPLMSGLLVLGIGGAISFLMFWPIGKILLIVSQLILMLFEKICSLSLELPGSCIVLGKLSLLQIVLYYVLLCGGLYVWHLYKKRKLILEKRNVKRILVGMVMLTAVLVSAHVREPGMTEITLVDVGQGDGIFIEGPSGKTYFIDGGSSTVTSVAKYRMIPFLNSKGIYTIDYLFVTHGDLDHMNGIEELLQSERSNVRVKQLVLPIEKVWDETLSSLAKLAKEKQVTVLTMNPNQMIHEKNVIGKDLTIRCLGPDSAYDGEVGNAASLILSVSVGDFDVLLTGDVEGAGEQVLMRKLEEDRVQYEVLKVAHHGSKNSSKDDFLEVMKPKYALISAGTGNFYGHPHKEALKRLEKKKIIWYCTKYHGALTVKINRKGNYKIVGWLKN